MGTSPDPPGRAASSDDTEDSSRSSIVIAPDSPFHMMLQFDISPDLLPVPDSAVVPPEGILVILYLFVAFSQFLFLRTLRGLHSSPLIFIWLNSEPV